MVVLREMKEYFNKLQRHKLMKALYILSLNMEALQVLLKIFTKNLLMIMLRKIFLGKKLLLPKSKIRLYKLMKSKLIKISLLRQVKLKISKHLL